MFLERGMRNILLKSMVGVWLVLSSAQAAICPDPITSSLQWGEIPYPWQANPFSTMQPQGGASFYRANILQAGLGRGVLCTYRTLEGYYSIWWEVNVKIPSRIENNWHETLGGYECTQPLNTCVFYP